MITAMPKPDYEQLRFDSSVIGAEIDRAEPAKEKQIPLSVVMDWIIKQVDEVDETMDALKDSFPNVMSGSEEIVTHASDIGRLLGKKEIIEKAAREIDELGRD